MFSSLPALIFGTLIAQQGDVHVHGHGALVIGVEASGRVEARLDVPAESLWGFEHAPRTEAERAAVSAAEAELQDADRLRFSQAANCTLQSVSINPGDEALGDTGGDRHGHRKRDHGHDHDHDHEAASSGHQDVSVHFRFHCDSPERIETISTTLFAAFERLQELDVVYIDSRRQAGFALTRRETVYRLPQ